MQAKQLLLSLSFCCAATAQAQMHSERPTSDAQALQQSSLSFIENKGQSTDQHGNPRHDISFQEDGKPIASRFVLQGDVLSFSTAPHTGTLTIDTTLSWSTYYNGFDQKFSMPGQLN